MKCLLFLLFLSMVPSLAVLSASAGPIQTDYVIFLFDNGEKNMIASMLNYARNQNKENLDRLDFRIVFMGASVDSMSKEPFCFYPEKLIHYRQLGIEETIDHHWKRHRVLSSDSMQHLVQNLHIRKKAWMGVSCTLFEQLVRHYQDNTAIEVLAVRDNPSPDGETDYFRVVDNIQEVAHRVAVPSELVAERLRSQDKEVVVVGHPPIEEWCEQALHLDKKAIFNRLGLDPQIPVIVYTGVYGDYYEDCFKRFLDFIPDEKIQVLIVPHPRYKGMVEKKYEAQLPRGAAVCKIVGEFEEDPAKKMRTIEAVFIADAIVTADATSTVVFQANALRKSVYHVNLASSQMSELLQKMELIQRVNCKEEFIQLVQTLMRSGKEPSVFKKMSLKSWAFPWVEPS